MSTFAERLRAEVKKHGLTTTTFAEEAGMPVPHACHVLQDDREPSLKTLRKILRALPKADARKLILGE